MLNVREGDYIFVLFRFCIKLSGLKSEIYHVPNKKTYKTVKNCSMYPYEKEQSLFLSKVGDIRTLSLVQS